MILTISYSTVLLDNGRDNKLDNDSGDHAFLFVIDDHTIMPHFTSQARPMMLLASCLLISKFE